MTVTGLSPAAGSPRPLLKAHDVHRIVKITGYHGLRSHRFSVATAFRSDRIRTVVVRLDRAHLAVPMPALRRDLHLAATLAGRRPAFTAKIRLGSHGAHKIRYDVAPAGVLAPRTPYVRYLIFTPRGEQLAELTKPQRVPAVQALTVIDPARRVNVTLLRGAGRGETSGRGVPAARLATMVESLNTSSYVYVAPESLDRLARRHINPTRLVAFGREIWSNSLGFAITAARSGTPYRAYLRQATRMRFAFYRAHDLHYLKFSAAQYRRLGR